MSSAGRIAGYRLALAVAGVLVGCSGRDVSPDAGKQRDAGTRLSDGGARDGTVAAACGSTRCAPSQSRVQSGKSCRCTHSGVRMRLGDPSDLAHDFYAQPWPLATRLRADGSPRPRRLSDRCGGELRARQPRAARHEHPRLWH